MLSIVSKSFDSKNTSAVIVVFIGDSYSNVVPVPFLLAKSIAKVAGSALSGSRMAHSLSIRCLPALSCPLPLGW